jgi:thymidylate synthase
VARTLDAEWYDTFYKSKICGQIVSPRGKMITELTHHTLEVDMNYPVLRIPERKLNYRFMAAEALWMVQGRDDLAPLTKFNPHMAAFSDNGETLAGAYGPRIAHQAEYVVDKLLSDRDTRQATLTTWIQNPKGSKDVPCTVAMDFKIRDDKLNMHVFMRSSDIWLGVPYDVFSFSMVARYILAHFNWRAMTPPVGIGTLFLTAASSHLYEDQWGEQVRKQDDRGEPCPLSDYCSPHAVIEWLDELKETRKGDPMRWWEKGISHAD